MIDAVSPPPQQIVQKMVECGVDRAGIVVEADGEATGIIIKVRHKARVTVDRIACIHQATDTALVIFDDNALQHAYDRYALERSRPAMLASAKAELDRLGLTERFPRRVSYADKQDYVRALERHAGFAAGSKLRVSGDGVMFDGGDTSGAMAGFERSFRIIAVVMYATAIGDLDGMSFSGNVPAAGPGQ
ncbi:hypothetical protein [Sphingomonas mollis]|uniref:Uncharacterized protein n=1 Tax=Sphingomonas mollis TaxID=2795726 RepID=A0ABS0XK07_9SPHN|nr:hypothetical protein [Sphingomonas sp. BT553]MBJ6120366.1 hypothetical protein [Sphingomonas sp. BT553]